MRLVASTLTLLCLGGCSLAEYVLPDGSTSDESTGAADPTGTTDAPTGDAGASTGTDTGTDASTGASTGGDDCSEVCKADELCIAGECRDVFDLDCAACPCPAQCPESSGLRGASDESGDTGGGGGGDPEIYLCCDRDDGPICVSGDQGDVLTCPQGQ